MTLEGLLVTAADSIAASVDSATASVAFKPHQEDDEAPFRVAVEIVYSNALARDATGFGRTIDEAWQNMREDLEAWMACGWKLRHPRDQDG